MFIHALHGAGLFSKPLLVSKAATIECHNPDTTLRKDRFRQTRASSLFVG